MGQLRCISRSGVRVFYAEEAAFGALEKWYTHTGHASFSSVDKCDSIFIDGGGSVFINESVTSFEINGTQFQTYTRHIPYIAEILQDMTDNKIKGCVLFSGFNMLYVITLETKNMLTKKLNELYAEHKDEIYKLESDLTDSLKQAGVAYLGKCSCQSGHSYKMCCGRRN